MLVQSPVRCWYTRSSIPSSETPLFTGEARCMTSANFPNWSSPRAIVLIPADKSPVPDGVALVRARFSMPTEPCWISAHSEGIALSHPALTLGERLLGGHLHRPA